MVASRLPRSASGFVVIALLIVAANLATLRVFALSEEEPMLVYAAMVDFMLVIPFFYWVMVLRRRGRSIAGVMALPLLGAAAVWVLVPPGQRAMVWGSAWPVEAVIVAAELAFVIFEARVVYKLIQGYRVAAREEKDTMEAWRIALRTGSDGGGGKLASIVHHDIGMVYYLLFSWRKGRAKTGDSSELTFTYHKKTNQILYAAFLTKVIVFEAVALHLLVSQWSPWAAWILTIADLWLLALIWADCRASVLQPVRLDEDRLRLRYGLRIQADVPLASIAGVISAVELHPEREDMKHALGPVLGTPNVCIELCREEKAEGMMFMPKPVKRLYLAMDEPDAFVRELERRMESRT
ncbi:hypothetical protein [Cohnella sp.]|uniref:hypothetical protein n=1 Tax=Cohnella sp. TaxID=1883426 RepID=UPI003567CAD5